MVQKELTAAMKLLDKRGSGYIEFDEFVDWWVNKVGLPTNKRPHLACLLHMTHVAGALRFALSSSAGCLQLCCICNRSTAECKAGLLYRMHCDYALLNTG